MVNIVVIVLVVFALVWLVSRANGGSSKESKENALAGSLGCLVFMVQILLGALCLYAMIGFFKWIF